MAVPVSYYTITKKKNKSVGIFQTNFTKKFKEENATHGVEN
jgi:hypothetical protein